MAATTNLFFTFIFLLFLRIASAKHESHPLHKSASKPSYHHSHDAHENHHSHETRHSHETHRSHGNPHAHHLNSPSKSKLLSLLSKSPVVLVVNTDSLGGLGQKRPDLSSDEDVHHLRAGDILKEEPKNQDAYVLYNALRTTAENNEELDSKTLKTLEHAKTVLKEKLVARCGQERNCKRACEDVKKPAKCKQSCREAFDSEDACPEEEKEEEKEKSASAESGCDEDGENCQDSCGDDVACKKKGMTQRPDWFDFE